MYGNSSYRKTKVQNLKKAGFLTNPFLSFSLQKIEKDNNQLSFLAKLFSISCKLKLKLSWPGFLSICYKKKSRWQNNFSHLQITIFCRIKLELAFKSIKELYIRYMKTCLISIVWFLKHILANWAKRYQLYLLDWWLWLDHWVHVQKSGLEQFELFFCFEGTWHFWKNLTASGLVWRVLMRILCCFLLYYRHNFISNYFRKV